MGQIYTPQGRAREYAAKALNIYRRCDHRCVYCYNTSPRMMGPEFFQEPVVPLNQFRTEALRRELQKGVPDDRVLLSFIGDPYCEAEYGFRYTRKVLEIFVEFQVRTAILTKGGSRVLRDVDLLLQLPDPWVGASLTFVDAEKSKMWEPGAASPIDRMGTLKLLHDQGLRTWVSFEPMVSPIDNMELFRLTSSFVDHYKLGPLNHYKPTLECPAPDVDWSAWGPALVQVLEDRGFSRTLTPDSLMPRTYYLKKDLVKRMGVSG